MLNGRVDIDVEVEKEVGELVGKDEGLCLSTGFRVNEGVIGELGGGGD